MTIHPNDLSELSNRYDDGVDVDVDDDDDDDERMCFCCRCMILATAWLIANSISDQNRVSLIVGEYTLTVTNDGREPHLLNRDERDRLSLLDNFFVRKCSPIMQQVFVG